MNLNKCLTWICFILFILISLNLYKDQSNDEKILLINVLMLILILVTIIIVFYLREQDQINYKLALITDLNLIARTIEGYKDVFRRLNLKENISNLPKAFAVEINKIWLSNDRESLKIKKIVKLLKGNLILDLIKIIPQYKIRQIDSYFYNYHLNYSKNNIVVKQMICQLSSVINVINQQVNWINQLLLRHEKQQNKKLKRQLAYQIFTHIEEIEIRTLKIYNYLKNNEKSINKKLIKNKVDIKDILRIENKIT